MWGEAKGSQLDGLAKIPRRIFPMVPGYVLRKAELTRVPRRGPLNPVVEELHGRRVLALLQGPHRRAVSRSWGCLWRTLWGSSWL